MRKLSSFIRQARGPLFLAAFSLLTVTLHAQSGIFNYVIFAGSGRPDLAAPPGGYGVQIGSSITLQGGSVGSHTLIQTTGNATLNTNLHSRGNLIITNSNVIGGDISAGGVGFSFPSTVVDIGSSTNISGNIDAYGNVNIGGGTVSGTVTIPTGATYTGPAPGGDVIHGSPDTATLPSLLPISSIPEPPAGATNFTGSPNNTSIEPGVYGDVTFGGNKTLTLNGPGTYTFRSFHFSGNSNKLVFSFGNNTTGRIIIKIYGDADFGKLNASISGSGSASRIFTEVHGDGSTTSIPGYSFVIANGSSGGGSKWVGTVWAPNAGINIGSGTGQSSFTGALYSATKVVMQSGVTLTHAPFLDCNTPPNANAGPDKMLSCTVETVQLEGSSTTPGAEFSWVAENGGIIQSGANTANPVISRKGRFILTVSAAGCSDTDTARVGFEQCVLPFYPSPPGGKVEDPIGSELTSLYENFGNVLDPALTVFIVDGNKVWIEVTALAGKRAELVDTLFLPSYGMTDTIPNVPNSLIITGKYPIANLNKLNFLPLLIDYVRPLFPPAQLGLATTQGDTAIRADFLRLGYGLNGDSVKIGVLSDSYNTGPGDPASTDIGNRDLPGPANPDNTTPVEVVLEYPYGQRLDEGRAMLQIIHDLAPKAKLAFRTAFLSAGDMANGIRQLRDIGCRVITDDVTYITEPFLTDGVIAQAANEVAEDSVAYFAAAGNFSNRSYTANFDTTAAPFGFTGHAHQFAPGDIYQLDSMRAGVYTLVLQWEDGFYSLGDPLGAQNDLDIYIVDNTGTMLFGFNRNNIGNDPIEVIPYTVTTNTTANIMIVHAAGPNKNVRFKFVVFRGGFKVLEYPSGSSTVVGQANATGVITLGAAQHNNTGVAQPYSSHGGTRVAGEVDARPKPDVVGPDGVVTTVNFSSGSPSPGTYSFFGTSAAAPHAAALGALLIQAKKRYYDDTLGPVELRSLMTSTARDMNTPGFDYQTGFGFLRADLAVQTFAAATPFLIRMDTASGIIPGEAPFTVTVHGNYLSESTTILLRGDSLETTFINDSTVTAEVPTFDGNPDITAFTPCTEGTVFCDGGLSNSIYFFSQIKKNVYVEVRDTTKKYGEALPAFSVNVTVDGVPVENTIYTLEDLGLDSIWFETLATSTSNVNSYLVTPRWREFDPNNIDDLAKLELFDYDSTGGEGVLTIQPMPLIITPVEASFEYGDVITNIDFTYDYDSSNIAPGERGAFMSALRSAHQDEIVDTALAFVDDGLVIEHRLLT
ncbi:MAG TPA: S8 family serine peptidase, partial [Chitinophagaceae bacterium]|nr:S8 family serine peptidase [Chitinophagaceae bacterium]